MEIAQFKRYLVYLNIALFTIASWYVIAEVLLSYIWQSIWH